MQALLKIIIMVIRSQEIRVQCSCCLYRSSWFDDNGLLGGGGGGGGGGWKRLRERAKSSKTEEVH